MLLKAYIKELPKIGDNKFKVRIPFLEDNTRQEFILDALLCGQPGQYNGYKAGDCVYVEFEDNLMDTPVIIGKLFVDIKDDIPTYQVVNDLKVLGKVELPDNTKFGGYSSTDLFKLSQKSGSNNITSTLSYSEIGEW